MRKRKRKNGRNHLIKNLVPIKLEERFCDDEENPCPHYNEELDWCRKKLQECPLGCEEQTVYVNISDPRDKRNISQDISLVEGHFALDD